MASGLDISIRSNLKDLTKSFDQLARKQIPYATALALTSIARTVQAAQTQALPTALHKKPTRFTLNAFGVIPATKATLTAVVFAKDAQAKYLAPSETGGMQLLGNKKAILNPKDIRLNQYGNIPKGTIASLKGRPDIFIGPIQTAKGGLISGVWQRVNVTPKGIDRKHRRRGSVYTPQHGALRLLIRWSEGTEIAPHLGYNERAQMVVQTNIQPEFAKAMSKAISTAKPT